MTSLLRNRVLGVCAFIPLLSVIGGVVFLYQHPAFLNALASTGDISPQLYAGSDWGLFVGGDGLVIGVGLYIYYLVRVIQTKEHTITSKIAWVLMLSIAAPIAIPIAWWKMDRRP